METYEVNKLILETRLVQLKKDADWWIVGGIYLTIIGSFTFSFYYLFMFIPLTIISSGLLVLLKGCSLMRSWMKIRSQYLKLIKSDEKDSMNLVPQY